MPSESVSTRSTVAPGYLARAAALTLLAVSPVSRCSSGRWLLDSSTARLVCGAPGAVTAYEPALAVVLAAFAVSVPASTPPTRSPPATSAAFPPQRRQPRRSSEIGMFYPPLVVGSRRARLPPEPLGQQRRSQRRVSPPQEPLKGSVRMLSGARRPASHGPSARYRCAVR